VSILQGKVQGLIIDGFHYYRETYRGWGQPFFVGLLDNESPEKLKERLALQLQIPPKEMEKVKIVFVNSTNKVFNIESGMND
jgi:hypothetical protein